MKEVKAEWGAYKFRANPQKVAEEIMSLPDKHTPQDVVDLAKDENTELHKCFTWDKDTAAEKWWRQEARIVESNLKITIVVEEKETKEMKCRLMHNTDTKGGYTSIFHIMKDDNEYEKLLERAYADMKSFKEKYKILKELEGVFAQMDEVLMGE